MTLPVSSYEELLARVRSLTSETIQLRREITSSLCEPPALGSPPLATHSDYHLNIKNHPRGTSVDDLNTSNLKATGGHLKEAWLLEKKEDEVDNEFKEIDEMLTSPDSPVKKNSIHRNGWAPDALGLWHSGPSSLNQISNNHAINQDLTASVTYNSHEPHSLNALTSSSKRTYSHQQLGAKVEMVYSLLSMLDMDNREDMSKTFLAMSSSTESCHAMRQSGCLPLLIQLIHSSELDHEVRKRAAEALHNVVHAQADEKRRRREVRVLKLLQQLREYCDDLRDASAKISQLPELEKHPINAIGTLMKFSFDAEHRQAICILGGLHAITELIQVDHEAHGSSNDDTVCVTLRRYAGMSLTNLTFGDGKNKALLCSFSKFMNALVDQLKSPSEDLRQVTASVLRNLSWRADSESKQALRNVGAVTALTVSAMEAKKESTLKSILSALWNLSAHCSMNKIDICSVPGALAFFVRMLRYKSASNTLAIVENAGGILRNISSHVAVREDYRQILRDSNCFEVLLEQLKSPSLTIVSNACGTLWNLSARCTEDQRRLWEMGAISMLRSLVQSKHKMISMGSSAALKNLLAANPNESLLTHLDSTAKSLGLQNLPTLFVRKKRALEQELNITLAETCDNIDPVGSPTHIDSCQNKIEEKNGNGPRRSDSRDSVQSTHSDSVFERINRICHKNEEKLLESKNITLHDSLDEKSAPKRIEDQKLLRRYKVSMIPTPTLKKMNQDRINEKTRDGTVMEQVVYETVSETDLNRNPSLDFKESKKERGIPVLSTKPKNKMIQSYQETENSSFSSRSNEGEVVDGKERESLEDKSHPCPNEVMDSVFRHEEDTAKNKNIVEGLQSSIVEKNKKKEEGVTNSQDCYSNTGLSSSLGDEKNSSSVHLFENVISNNIFNEVGKDINDNSSDKETKEFYTCNNRISSNGHSQIISKTPKHEDFADGYLPSADFKLLRESSSKDPILNDSFQNFSNKSLPLQRRECQDSGNSIKMKVVDAIESSEALACNMAPNLPQQSHSVSSSELEDGDSQDQKKICHDTTDMETGRTKSICETLSTDGNKLQNSAEGAEIGIKPKLNIFPHDSMGDFPKSYTDSRQELEKLNFVNVDGDDVKTSVGGVLPKFKIGSPMTDSRVLQMEVNKICREIKKHQECDMGCSLTSEVSLVSCSSFLDPGDCSLFDSSTDAIDLDDSENILSSKASYYKFKNFSSRKPISLTAESIGLPSLGSLKDEQIEALELDNSVLSVSSITSEIAETYSKDPHDFNTYTKTYKIDGQNEVMEETVADITLVSDGEDTLNADSAQNIEFCDEDCSLHSQENLPLDPEPTSDRIKRKLTPKEKRKTFHERYRTYTIRDFQVCKSSKVASDMNDQGGNVNPVKKDNEEIGICARNASELHSVTNSSTDFNLIHEPGFEEEMQGFDSSVNFTNRSKHETFQFSKSFDKEKESVKDFVLDSRSLNDLLSIGPDERKELVNNAKLVAFSLKTAIHDSEYEMEDPPKSLDIDTATYTKNYRSGSHRKFSSQEPENLESYVRLGVTEDLEKKGARILKPTEKSNEKVELSKGVRGKRKPLYSSPSRTSPKNDSHLNLSKMSEAIDDIKKLSLETGKTLVLNRQGTFTKQNGPDLKKTEGVTSRTIPVLLRNPESKNSKSVTKNKTSLFGVNSKRAGESHISKIGRPPSSYISRNNERRPESDSSQRRPFSAGAANRTGGDGALTTKKSALTNLASPKLRNSSSNQSIKSGGSPGSGCTNSKNLLLQNSKSRSDASLNLVASKEKIATGKQKTPKKEATSKIANLWRKVEETKQKSKNFKDNRVWIGPEKKSTKTGDEILVIEQEEILDIPTQKIVHSFTCQTLADETSINSESQKRNQRRGFLKTESSEETSHNMERRNIISAIVSPYNYNPPVSAQASESDIHQVNNFHKGSLKVTAV